MTLRNLDPERRQMSAGTPSDGSGPIRTPAGAPGASGGAGESTCGLCLDLPHRRLTHCTHCHASWTRTSRTAHCPTCHRTFSTPRAFDRHLLKEGCTDPAGVTKRNGEHVFVSDPRPNNAGTPVWYLAGSGWTGPGEGRR